MKKLILMIFSMLFIILTLASCSIDRDIITYIPPRLIDDNRDEILNNYIDNLLNQTTSYIPAWNQESFKGKWNYIDGVFLKSIVDLYNKTNNEKYIKFVKNYVDYYIDSEGNFISLNPDVFPEGYVDTELDSVCESKILFDLYNYTNDNRYLNAINYTYESLKNYEYILPDGICYSHKKSYLNQVWLDGFYMYAPFLSRYANEIATNKSEIFDKLYDQYVFVANNMYDSNKQLYYHAYSYDDIFWANSNKCSSSFWLRSIGWFLASLPDTLEYYPEGNKKEVLKEIYKEAIDGVLNYLDTDYYMFYQIVDKKDESRLISYDKYLRYLNNAYTQDTVITNYLESSGSSLISYSLLKGYKLKILDDVSYQEIGIYIFNGVYNKSFDGTNLNDICIQAGLGPKNRPYRDGTFEYYLAEKVGSNDAKGVGPFLMAYVNLDILEY